MSSGSRLREFVGVSWGWGILWWILMSILMGNLGLRIFG